MDIKDMPVVTVEQITRFRNASLAEIERLNALVAMQAEALKLTRENLRACQAVIHLVGGFDPLYVSDALAAMKFADAALSATAETVSAWQSKRDNEIMANAVDEGAHKISFMSSDTYGLLLPEHAEAASWMHEYSSELRAKGE